MKQLVTASYDRSVRLWQLVPERPDQPSPPTLSGATHNSVNVQWTVPVERGSEITSFVLLWRDRLDAEFESSIRVHPLPPMELLRRGVKPPIPPVPDGLCVRRGNECVATVRGLKPGMPVQFKLAAENDVGMGRFSRASGLSRTEAKGACKRQAAAGPLSLTRAHASTLAVPERVEQPEIRAPQRTSLEVWFKWPENGGTRITEFVIQCRENVSSAAQA